jgi:translation initiation factor 1
MLEAECSCPPLVIEPPRLPPESQTARLRLEKRPKGKVVTVVSALDPDGNDLPALTASLKASCGTGGTLKEGRIELQGDHLQAVERALEAIGYNTKRT